jgi:hypothetical protein
MAFLLDTEYLVYDTNANLDMISVVATSKSKDIAESIAVKMHVASGYTRDLLVYNPAKQTVIGILSEETKYMNDPNAL